MKIMDNKIEIMNKLSEIISEILDKEVELSFDIDLFDDLDIDSIEVFQLIVKAEEVFGIEFNDIDLLGENFNSIGNFCLLIQNQIQKGGINADKEKEKKCTDTQ